jgi:type VI protein secretion system component VasK
MEARAMTSLSFGGILLRLQLALRTYPLLAAGGVIFLACAGGLAWTLHAAEGLDAERDALVAARAVRQAAPATAAATATTTTAAQPAAPAPVPAADPLEAFYTALGPRRYAEQQVRTLFTLAAKNGLSLSQGDYKAGYDRNARVATYQVNLPVKGSYAAVWQFAMGALRAIPFASLDDISFRRDDIKDPLVEARLRLTLYLKDAPGGER